MNHYQKEELDRYLHKDVNFVTRRKIKNHLNNCSVCSKILQQLVDDDNLLKDIRQSYKQNIPDNGIGQKTYTKLSSILGGTRTGSSVA